MPVSRGVIDAYRSRLSVPKDAHVVTLGEGGTPLIHSERLSARTGLEVWLKFEGANPTGSFKDRGMTVALTSAVHQGAKAIVCASTGNTSASASAYAARAGITCAVLIPGGKVALGKLAQAMIHGARVVEVNANFDTALEITRKLEDAYPITLVNSINPMRIEGQKTAAFEVCDALGRAPDYHVIPVGNAGNITSYWKGYSEYLSDGIIDSRPKMFGFQAEGASPIVLGHPVTEPKTIASAIRIGNPASWDGAVAAAKDSGGQIRSVRDKEILYGYRLAAAEGLFCEMASAASIAGLLQLSEGGVLERGKSVVCVLTGHGLKDTDWALAGAPQPVKVEPNAEEVAAALGL